MIKVSVIIPCYNSERFLEECLDSILGQTLQEIEVICVDDGSTDGTMGILHRYAEKDKRIQILVQQNQYAGVARNNGMAVATGKYLSFLDSDDFFEPFMLKKMYDKCEQDEADICVCGGGTYDMKTGQVSHEYRWLTHRLLPISIPFSRLDIPKSIFNFTNPAPWNKLFRASFVKENGLKFQSLPRANDLYFTFTALAIAEKITVLDQWLVNYRTGTSTSLTETMDDDPYCFYEAIKEVKSFLVQREIFDELEESYTKSYIGSGLHALRMTKSKEQWLSELWKNRKHTSWREMYKMTLVSIKSVCNKLVEYNPKPRQNKIVVQERDPAWDFLLNDNPLKVSVIIPVFNVEKYVEECLRSVLHQSLRDIEIICVDDGSNDNSLKIVEQIAREDNRIRIICQENQGLSATRNNALKIAKGEYVMFLDSDDLLVWCTLEHLYRKAKYYDLDDIFCGASIFFDPVELYKGNNPYKRVDMYNFKGNYPEPVSGRELLKKMTGIGDFKSSVCIRLFKQSFLQENKLLFHEGIIHEDEIFTVHSLNVAKRSWIHNEPLYLRRIRPDSIMTREKSWKNVYGYYMCLLEFDKMITKEETEFKQVLQKFKYQHKKALLRTYSSISEKEWLNFSKEMSNLEDKQLPFTFSLIVKMVKREVIILKEKNQLGKTYRSCSWRLMRVISSPRRLVRGIISKLIPILEPIVLRSRALTSLAYKVYRKLT